ncbi:hypothetical protein MJI37_32935, partial [Salmonella enterica subsp. enterica serovar Cerro]|nr:hypothetical protein [Salmonella enterica subsp. enterica serovar Cerro]
MRRAHGWRVVGSQNEDWPWDDALAIPLLVNLTAQEQARLIALAERFLQQKRLVA